MTAPQSPLDRNRFRVLYWALAAGICVISTVFGWLLWMGTAPLIREGETRIIAGAIAAAALGPILLGWLWALPQVPRRAPGGTVESYWGDPNAGARALLLWVLFEGATVMCAVGTLLTGSTITAGVGLLAFALFLLNGPGYLEERQG